MKQNRMYRWVLFAFLILTYQVVFAQTNHLAKEISISVSNVKLGDVLYQIGTEGNFHFSYNAELIEGDKLVSFNCENQTVEEILSQLLNEDVNFKVVGSHIILLQDIPKTKLSKENRKVEYMISGFIIDSRTGKKISSATIYDINGNCTAITDEEGYYTLNFPINTNSQGFNYCKKGYLDTVIIIEPQEKQKLDIYLTPNQQKIQKIDAKTTFNETDDISTRPLVKGFVPKEAVVTSENLNIFEKQMVQISFLPYLGSGRMIAGSVYNKISVNVLAGFSGGIKGVEVGGLLNIIKNDVEGVHVAGFANIVGNNTSGVQVAGFTNINAGSVKGIQIAGFNNTVLNDISGIQIAGFNNTLKGDMYGMQVAGFSNLTTQNVDGIQISGFSNVTLKDVNLTQISGFSNYCMNVRGCQISGFSNVAIENVDAAQISGFQNYANNVKGVQISGFSNVAIQDNTGGQIAGFTNYAQNVKGVQVAGFLNVAIEKNTGGQIAGFMNYAGHLDGSQVAVINFADTISSGIPIGFFSYVRKGYHKIEITTNEVTYANIGFKTGTSHFYNIFQAGFNGSDIFSSGYGLGSMFTLNEKLSLSLDLTSHIMFNSQNRFNLLGSITKFSPSFDFKLAKHLTITAGPSLNVFVSNPITGSISEATSSSIPLFPFFNQSYGNTDLQMWVGGNVGVRF